jgi:hypothetical protein
MVKKRKVKVYKKAIEKCKCAFIICYQCCKCGKVVGLPPRNDCRTTLENDYNTEQMHDTWRGME